MRPKFYPIMIVTLSLAILLSLLVTTTVDSEAAFLTVFPLLRPTVDPHGPSKRPTVISQGPDESSQMVAEKVTESDEGQDWPQCDSSVKGQVIHWAVGPADGITIRLGTGSWQTFAASSSDGSYQFAGLGTGIATLQVILAPLEQRLPLIQDAGVYLTCDRPIMANIALYGDPPTNLPVTIQASTSNETLHPGEPVDIQLTIKNNLPTDITQVMVTYMIPEALAGKTALTVSTFAEAKRAQIIDGGEDGQLVVINLDQMASGAEETMVIKAIPGKDLSCDTTIKNVATLFYSESTAVQTEWDFKVACNE